MKLIMLPGLDGTGKLFRWPLPYLTDLDVTVLPLPQEGPQNYAHLAEVILQYLPSQENFVLLGESFSGALAMRIAQTKPPGLVGVIFVAGFLSPPRPWLLSLGLHLPLGNLSSLPFSHQLFRYLGFEAQTQQVLIEDFAEVLREAGTDLLKARIRVIQSLVQAVYTPVEVPALLIKATRDRLVNPEAQSRFADYCPALRESSLDAPHLVFQTRPERCAEIIGHFINELL